MTLQSAIEAELPGLRAEALARMTSRATIMRATGSPTTSADGFQVPEWATVTTDLPFRLGGAPQGSGGYRTVSVASSEVQVPVRIAHFPAETTGLADNDLVLVTAGENAGIVLRILEADWQDQATARRVPVVGVEPPEEWS